MKEPAKRAIPASIAKILKIVLCFLLFMLIFHLSAGRQEYF